MKPQANSNKEGPDSARVARLFRRLGLVYLVLLCLSLLMPLDLGADIELVRTRLGRLFSIWPATGIFDTFLLADFIQNIVLFIPLGFLLRLGGFSTAASCAIGFAVSFVVESTQLFMATRVSSGYDFLTNGTGALAGALLVGPCLEPLRKLGAKLLSFKPQGGSGAVLTWLYAVLTFFILLVPVVPPRFESWNPRLHFYLGGIPADRSFWRGTIHEIQVEAFGRSGKGSSVVTFNFHDPLLRKRLAEELSLPNGVSLTPDGIKFEGGMLQAPRFISESFFRLAGFPGSLCFRLKVTPALISGGQEGMVAAWGKHIRRYDFCIRQECRDLYFFARSSISGASWDQPRAYFNKCVEREGLQTWEFHVGPSWVRLRVDGRSCGSTFYLEHYSNPAGLLLASPFLAEPVSLAAFVLFPLGLLIQLLPGKTRIKTLRFFACLASFVLIFSAGSFLLGFRPDRDFLAGAVLGFVLGRFVGSVWPFHMAE